MRQSSVGSLWLVAALAAPLAAQTPTPTPASAVDPAGQSAVAPALPLRAGQPNPQVILGSSSVPATPVATPPAASGEPASASVREVETPSVSSPPSSLSPAAGRAHAKAGVVAPKPVTVSHEAAPTVVSYQKGKSLTVKTPSGSLVEYRLGKGTILPEDLGPGRQVLVETKIVKKRRVATRVSYAEGRVVLTNVN